MPGNEFDLVVLGGGMGGYVAAIRASQLGMRVAVIKKTNSVGLASIGVVYRAKRCFVRRRCTIQLPKVMPSA
jgi:flavin-dependent dehydrogenase